MWKLQANKELQEMKELRHYNNQLLCNILPDHVAKYFLNYDTSFSSVRSLKINDIITKHLL